jgi:hypothetical protein
MTRKSLLRPARSWISSHLRWIVGTVGLFLVLSRTIGTLSQESVASEEIVDHQLQTEPVAIQVSQAQSPFSSPESTRGVTPPAPDQEDPPDEDIVVKTQVDIRDPFVGQQVVYKAQILQQVIPLEQPRFEWPPFDGFWQEPLTPKRVYARMLNGRQFRVTELSQALFPTLPGTHLIESAVLIIPGNRGSSDTVVESNPISVDVRPLPATPPDGFSGVVGMFDISASNVPSRTLIGEPVRLIVRVTGLGNIHALSDPTAGLDQLLSDWRVHNTRTTINVSQHGDQVFGEKSFERLLLPLLPGTATIPAFTLVFFDPTSVHYVQTSTEPLTIMVSPDTIGTNVDGGTSTQLATTAPRKTEGETLTPLPRGRKTDQPSIGSGLFYWAIWVLPPFILIGVWYRARHRRQLSEDQASIRARRAHRVARQDLADALRIASSEPEATCTRVALTLHAYLADKFNLYAAGLTTETIRQLLDRRRVPQELIDRSLGCLEQADRFRFAPATGEPKAHDLALEALQVVDELENAMNASEPKTVRHQPD